MGRNEFVGLLLSRMLKERGTIARNMDYKRCFKVFARVLLSGGILAKYFFIYFYISASEPDSLVVTIKWEYLSLQHALSFG